MSTKTKRAAELARGDIVLLAATDRRVVEAVEFTDRPIDSDGTTGVRVTWSGRTSTNVIAADKELILEDELAADLQATATELLAETPGENTRIRRFLVVKLLRERTGCGLAEAARAIDHALAQVDIARYLDPISTAGRWTYCFPNGWTATVLVHPQPDNPFRWDVYTDNPTDTGDVLRGLTTGQVEAKLTAVYHLPAA